MLLNSETFAIFEIASVTGLRGELPNGVPKMACDVSALMMKRPLSLVVAAGSAAFGSFREFMVSNVGRLPRTARAGFPAGLGETGFPPGSTHTAKPSQASPA